MHNIFSSSFKQKESFLENTSINNKEQVKLEYILKNGEIVYLFDEFNFDVFTSTVKLHLHNELKLKTNTVNHLKEFAEITYNAPDSFASKINVGIDFSLLFLKIDKILCFNIITSNQVNENPEKASSISISSILNSSHKKEISAFIYETIHQAYFKKHQDSEFNFKNSFIEETHQNEQIFIAENIKNERILAKLDFSTIKNKDQNRQIIAPFNSSLIITNLSVFIHAFSKTGENIVFEKADEAFQIHKGLTKNTLTYKTLVCSLKRTNSYLFKQIKNIQKYSEHERIREFVTYNYLNNNYGFALQLINDLIKKESNVFNQLIYLLILLKNNNKTIQDTISESDLTKLFESLLLTDHAEKEINKVLSDFKIDLNEKIFLLELFVQTAKNSKQKNKIIPLYKRIRLEFKKKNKDLLDRTFFDINFAEFLIESDKPRKATGLLKALMKHLPDETISDVLPQNDINPLSPKSGQILKLKILNLLTLSQGKHKSEKELQKSVELQPLNEESLYLLAESKNKIYKQAAKDLISLLNKKGLDEPIKEIPVQKYKALKPHTLNVQLRHPATAKKGSFYSVQKWISKIKAEDYSSIKEFAEKITPSNYPKYFQILENLQFIFNIPDIEFYISRGETSNGIIAYEGNPPFVIIGCKHMDKQSELFLNYKEFQFSIATELAHLFYKHLPISSNDVWRGVIDKGSLLLDTLISILPVAGITGKSIKNTQKYGRLANILKDSTKIAKGKSIFETALKLTAFYNFTDKTDSNTEKHQKLLAASRLMQYTADRVGLVISGNIKSAVRAIFLTGKYNFEYFEEAKKTSLKELILKINNDGTYKHQDIALRLAQLFSFYVSDTYSIIREELTKSE